MTDILNGPSAPSATMGPADFERPPGGAYFDGAYLSLLPHAARAAAARGLNSRAAPWADSGFQAMSDRLRSLVATLVNAASEDIALIPSTSYGMALARRLFPVAPGERVVVLDGEHPSAVLAWQAECAERGAMLERVAHRPGTDPGAAIIDAIGPDVAIVCLPPCHWIDGTPVDLVSAARRCREVGARLVIDATQAIGARPFDVAAIRPDFACFSGYKWLLGPSGIGYVYVRADHVHRATLEYSWTSVGGFRRRMFDDDGRLDYRVDPPRTAARYDAAGVDHQSVLPMAVASLERIVAMGTGAIHDVLRAGIAELHARLPGMPFLGEAGDRHFCAIATRDSRALADRLRSENVFVSARGHALRISGHVWNDDSDLERLTAALQRHFRG